MEKVHFVPHSATLKKDSQLRLLTMEPFLGQKECPYFATFLKVFAFFYALPFEVKKNLETGEYMLCTTTARKILCGFVHVYIVFLNFIWLCSSLWRYMSIRHDISSTFYIVSQIASLGALVVLQQISWLKQKEIETFVQKTTISCIGSTRYSKGFTAVLTFGVAFASYAHGCLSQQTAQDAIHGYNFMKALLSPIFIYFDFHPVRVLRTIFSANTLMSVGNAMAGGFYVVINIQLTTMVILGLTFRKVITDHVCVCIENSYGNIDKVADHYQELKELTLSTRSLLGHFVLCHYIAILAFFAELPQVLLIDAEMSTRLLMMFYMIVICCGVGIAVIANTTAEDSLRNCIARHHCEKNLPTNERLKLIALSQELDKEPIGISCWFFTISRGFITATIGLIVTYGMIILQMSEKEKVFWSTDSNTT